MRILRGKSNLEVSSQGFAWFVVGLVLATFVGGAIRTILTSDRVHQRIMSELRNRFPQHEFQIGQTEVLLSRGMWPGLGLRVKNLTFRQDVCGKLSFTLEVPSAVLPVDLLALRKGKVRLGEVELTNGRIHFDYRPCEGSGAPTSAAAAAAESAPKQPALVATSLDWQKAAAHLDAIELQNFTLTYERNVTWKVVIHSMELELDKDLSAQGLMEVQKSLPFGALTHMVDIDVQGDDSVLQWSIQSEFKEGNINLKGSLDLNNSAAIVQASARQLPLKDLMSELHQMGFVERDLRLKTTWLSCSVKWEGPLSRPQEAPMQAHDCKIEGGYGRIDLEKAEFWLDNPSSLKQPAVLRVSKLQMQPVLDALGRQVLPRVLAKPGVWSGELSYLTPASWKLDGHLESAEVVFSHRSVRGKQVIERLRTQVERTGTKIEAAIKDVQIRGGDFAGQLDFKLEDDWRNGEFKADIQKLRFSPAIQNLLVGGVLGELKFAGRGTLLDGELGQWDGQFELAEVSGDGWRGEGIRIRSNYKPGVFHLEGRATQGTIQAAWKGFAQLQTIRSGTTGAVQWSSIQANVDILAAGGSIHSVTALEEGTNQPWKLKGSWVRDGDFSAALTVGGGKGQTFALEGTKGTLKVQGPLR